MRMVKEVDYIKNYNIVVVGKYVYIYVEL